MSIRDLIAQKKKEFFTAKTPEGLRAQRDELVKQKNILKERETLRQEVVKEQEEIRSLRTAPLREKLAKFKGNAQGLRGVNDRANQFFHGGQTPGLIAAYDRRQAALGNPDKLNGKSYGQGSRPGLPTDTGSSGFPKPSGLFAGGEPTVPKTNAPKANTKTIVINIKE